MRSLVKWIWSVAIGLLLVCGSGYAETYHLDSENSWQSTGDIPESQYLLAVSEIKQQLLVGTESDVVEALEKIKADFPDLAGREIDAYLKAEKLYAKSKWRKAATSYKDFLDTWPDSVLQPAALERIYSIGTAYLQGQKRTFMKIVRVSAFDLGEGLMWDIVDKAGNAPISLRALTTLAENQERKEMFYEAFETWREIADKWSTGPTYQAAVLRMAKALHASYDGPAYDASALENARTYFEKYAANPHTGPAEKAEADKTIAMITGQLAYKEYEIGLYYERTNHPQAAQQSYQKVLATWPDSRAAQMVQARLAPDAVSPVKMTAPRGVVNGTTWFLDNWFGIGLLLGSADTQDTQE